MLYLGVFGLFHKPGFVCSFQDDHLVFIGRISVFVGVVFLVADPADFGNDMGGQFLADQIFGKPNTGKRDYSKNFNL